MAVAEQMERYARRTALVTEAGEDWSYARLAQEARAITLAMPPASLVVIEGDNSPATVAAYLAVLLHGGVAHIGEPGRANALRPLFGPLVRIECTGETARVHSDPDIGSAGAIHPDLVLLFGTSGTTGASKMVKITDRNILSNTRAIIEYLGLAEDDRAITSLRPGYTYGLSVINSQILSGGAILLTNRSVLDPQFWAFARAQRATVLSGVPHMYELLAHDSSLEATPSLRLLTQAGGKLRADLVRAYAQRGRSAGWRFCVMYGQTEAAPRIAYLPPEFAEIAPEAIGLPIPGGMLSLEDEEGRLIEEAGVEGELIYRGPNVMAGYALQRQDLADATPGDRLATGDLAVRRSDGLYVITGRRSRFIKPLGRRIGLDEVEQMLAGRGILAAALPQGEGMLVAYEGNALIDTVKLADDLGIPVSIITIQSMVSLPRLASGKIDYVTIQRDRSTHLRRWLPTNLVRFARDTTLEAWKILRGRGETRDVISIVSEVLHRPVQPEDSFVGLGADSLSYVELSIALEDAAGALPDGWIHLRIRDLERWRSGVE